MKLFENKADKEYYLNAVKKEWLAASDTFPDFLSEVTAEKKVQNEQYIQTVSEDFKKQINGFPRVSLGRKKWKQKTLDLLTGILNRESVIGIHQSMDEQMISCAKDELMEFMRHVRSFSPELSFSDIGQAIRNYIVYVMFKNINQIKTGFSMPCFGYSMLYPFTDNYIDNKNVSNKEKAEYNKLIRDTIEGREVHPETLHQRKTCELLQAIAAEYPRENDPSIYTLLLMMLEAQEISMRHQFRMNGESFPAVPVDQAASAFAMVNNCSSPVMNDSRSRQASDNDRMALNYEKRLDISLYKGGISVLIDRFLINKELTENDLIFYLGLGFFLQIADDLQDIKDDSIHGNQTIFTLDLSCGQEEKLVNKMMHFIHNIMEDYQAENNNFKDFILSNCYQLIHLSLDRSKEFFTKEYLNKSEKYFLVTFSFYEKLKENMNVNTSGSNEQTHMKVLDYILFN